MKRVIILIMFLLMMSPMAKASWCIGETPLYICVGSTIDLSLAEFGQNVTNKAAYIAEESNKAMNQVSTITQTDSTVSDGNASGAEVSNLNLSPSTISNSDPIQATLTQQSGISASELSSVSPAASVSQDKIAQQLIYLNFIKADGSIAARETLYKNRDSFYISGLMQSLSLAYDATQKLEEISSILNKLSEDSLKDGDYNRNVRARFSLNELKQAIKRQSLKVDAARALLEIRENIYLSPNFANDATSTLNLGSGSSAGAM